MSPVQSPSRPRPVGRSGPAPWLAIDGDGAPSTAPPPRGGVYLHPGAIAVIGGGGHIRTVLGSCVAVCLWEPASQVGGMCHYVLPGVAGAGASTRLGGEAIPELVRRVRAAGGARAPRAKIFGGSRVLMAAGGVDLGAANVRLAHELLRRARIGIVYEDSGGRSGQSLLFSTADGTTWHRRLGTGGPGEP